MNLRRPGWLAASVLAILAGFAALAGFSARDVARFDVQALARQMPERTALMLQREAEANRDGRRLVFDVRTVPYEGVSPLLRRAILIAEDDAFFSHDGLDWSEIRASAKTDLKRGRLARGGSTITQQLAKNLFLGSERSIIRKLREAFLAVRIERALTKRRIFELYLNRIEWGRGIFGIEAASRRYFGVSAMDLSPRQALLLAAVIINPIRFSVLAPPPRIERRVRMIADRMKRRGYLDDAQYREAIGLPRAAEGPDSGAAPWEGSTPDSGAGGPAPAVEIERASPSGDSLPN